VRTLEWRLTAEGWANAGRSSSLNRRRPRDDATVTTTAILFPLGVRLSTWLMALVFVALAVKRRDSLPILALLAWLFAFEAAYDAASIGLRPWSQGFVPAAVFFLILGTATVVWMTSNGVRPFLPLTAAAALLMAVWMATGFHQNFHDATTIDPGAEALNEGAKTLLAAAYLVPVLLRTSQRALLRTELRAERQ
jgi:hypothetical protein